MLPQNQGDSGKSPATNLTTTRWLAFLYVGEIDLSGVSIDL